MDTIQSSCRSCGPGVQTNSEQCEYCGNPVRVLTLKIAAKLSRPVLLNYVNNYESAIDNDKSAPLALGILSLQLRQLLTAKERFDASINANPTNAEAYFYRAIACLDYKKPFMCQRPVIDDVLRAVISKDGQVTALPLCSKQ